MDRPTCKTCLLWERKQEIKELGVCHSTKTPIDIQFPEDWYCEDHFLWERWERHCRDAHFKAELKMLREKRARGNKRS